MKIIPIVIKITLRLKRNQIFLVHILQIYSFRALEVVEDLKMSGGEGSGRLGNVITNPEGELPPPVTSPGPHSSQRGAKNPPNLLRRPCMYLAW